MCGRYVSPEEAEIERFWHIGRHNNDPFQRRFNVSPTQIIPILRLDRETGEIELVNARWGLIPNWWKDAKPPRTTHNARAEEAATKPMWKGPLARARCLIPAVGWYEWKTFEQADAETGEIKQVKQPHFFHLPDNQLFSFAGIHGDMESAGRGCSATQLRAAQPGFSRACCGSARAHADCADARDGSGLAGSEEGRCGGSCIDGS
jgi:putative SOS response-associated peptidase YedK